MSIQNTAYTQAGAGSCSADEIDGRGMGQPQLASPVLTDERKESRFDFVPFAGSRRQVVNVESPAAFVGEALKFPLPQKWDKVVSNGAPQFVLEPE